jgi:hypothetical protein
MAFGSQWISFVERSRSSFYFYSFCFICVQVRIFLFLPTTSTRTVSGRFRLIRAEFPTRTCRCIIWGDPLSSRVKSVCLPWEINAYTKLWSILWSIFWASSFVNSNAYHLICNNYFITWISWYYMLMWCVCTLTSSRIPQYDIGRQTPAF